MLSGPEDEDKQLLEHWWVSSTGNEGAAGRSINLSLPLDLPAVTSKKKKRKSSVSILSWVPAWNTNHPIFGDWSGFFKHSYLKL